MAEMRLVTTDDLNIRDAPDLDGRILRTLPKGTTVWAVDESRTDADGQVWRRVSTGEVGYVAERYLAAQVDGVAPGGKPFDPNTPTELQVQNWTCSIRSVMWMLKSVGIAVTPAEAQDAMVPRYVNQEVGLRDASGAGVVQVLREHWGLVGHNQNPISFDEVAAKAGTHPLMIGGRTWGHWTAVRGFDGARLVLANPGGTGPRYGQQTLDRDQFHRLGPFSAVWMPYT